MRIWGPWNLKKRIVLPLNVWLLIRLLGLRNMGKCFGFRNRR